ncbi:MAG: anthranilate synthase component I [Gloeobacterales cyanobacterium]
MHTLALHVATSPSLLFEQLFTDEPIAVLLESPGHTRHPRTARYSYLASIPRKILTPPLGSVCQALEHWLADAEEMPLLGWLGYDVAWEIEHLPWQKEDTLPFPVAFWFEPEVLIVYDHWEKVLTLKTRQDPDVWIRRIQAVQRKCARLSESVMDIKDLTFLSSPEEYQEAVHRAKEYIHAGDIFQSNLSLRFQAARTGSGDSLALYQQLQSLNPSPFASYWRTPWGEVVSCSPERLVKREGPRVETRPIAGTRPRGMTPEKDQSLEEELLANVKEQAEHIMLVDLERNDLGRVCRYGSIEVDELLTIERYSHVMHIVSNVVGEIRAEASSVDLIRAVFPGGTITGCPKIRCMEIIEKLEPARRSLFYGSCGWLAPNGDLDLNILIRTLLVTEDSVYGQVGAGIVADSDPVQEYLESVQKAKALLAALGWR